MKKRVRKKRKIKAREAKFIDAIKFVDDYLAMQDWRVRENANIAYSFSSLFLQAAGETITRYTLSKVYPREISRAHVEGDFHIHNLAFGIVGYCAGWSIKDLLMQGFSGVPARTESAPPRHFSPALLQISNFLGSIQNEWSISKDELLLVANEGSWKVDKISNLPERVRVFAFDANLRIKEAEGRVVKHGKSRLLEILTWHGHRVRITPDHSLFTLRDGEVSSVRGGQLKPGDKILIPARLPFGNQEFTFDLTKTSAEETYGNAHIHVERGWHEVPRLVKLDEPLATLLGFYIAEGSVRDEKVGADVFFSISRNESCLEKAILQACEKLGFPCRVYKPSFRPSETYIFIGSKIVRDFFVAKCGRHEKRVPSEIFRSNKKLIAAFLKACFSGDGHIHRNKRGGLRVCFKSTSEKLRSGINYLLRMFGIIGKPAGNAIFISGREDVERFYREIGFYHPAKMKSIKSYLNRKRKLAKVRCLEPLPGTDLVLVTVRSIRGLPEEEVYDISVPNFENFVGGTNPVCLHNSGAQAINSLDVYLAPFVRKDRLDYKQVKQTVQEFIYNLNISSRWGGQTPFTNVTFELKVPKDMEKEPVIVGGKKLDETYADYQPEVDLINRAFLDVMLHGDMRGRIFTFPIPTYSITKDFNWDSEVSNLLFQLTAKFGVPYFQNCIKGGIDPHEVRAMCCRLMLDMKELHRRYGGYFGYADKTGSLGVVTINMPRLGYLSKNETKFFERLGKLMELAKESLEIKRRLIDENMKRGLLPFSARYLGTLKFHFSTIGLVGMHEACLNLLGEGIETKSGKDFAIRVLKFMRERLVEFQNETGNIYNLEATPAEGTSHRLARIDKQEFRDIITSGKKVPYYTNSTFLPVGFTNNLVEALRHQDDLQVLYNGGTVLHAFLGEAVSSAEGCKIIVRKIAENFKLPYYTLTPTFSICMTHGYLSGEHPKCPHCRKPAEVYSRVVGYYRPVRNWHVGKQEEFRERLEYDEKITISSMP
jgi:anaerobic ribonucleoside-triphosphate reductase